MFSSSVRLEPSLTLSNTNITKFAKLIKISGIYILAITKYKKGKTLERGMGERGKRKKEEKRGKKRKKGEKKGGNEGNRGE